ncbi:MAG TPA: type II toxin-antitoxin system VapC family toxin [Rhizomicrobium sp.]|nr:type II toxin-antitoxin system VapC family toxin [Rhizomicrobium sp.]
MGLYFLDTSVLVKLYVQEPGTDRLLHLLGNNSDKRVAVLSLSMVEARSAIRRRQRAGDIDQDAADFVIDLLRKHMESRFLRQPVNDTLIDYALDAVDRYALRAYDAMQLAGCLVLSAMERRAWTFVCSDRQLVEAARSADLSVLDPTA